MSRGSIAITPGHPFRRYLAWKPRVWRLTKPIDNRLDHAEAVRGANTNKQAPILRKTILVEPDQR